MLPTTTDESAMTAPKPLVAIVRFFSPPNEVVDEKVPAIRRRLFGLALHLTIFILLACAPEFSSSTISFANSKFWLLLMCAFQQYYICDSPLQAAVFFFAYAVGLSYCYWAAFINMASNPPVLPTGSQTLLGWSLAFFAYSFGATLRNGTEDLPLIRGLIQWYPNIWRMNSFGPEQPAAEV
ncbi:hypothetical protein MKEN_00029500 [Mycena kentingensis (nom. inval.)]|nr:hypothetical protein MKEN_00029500 [Mycena kentingensis (nom. inval.)]